MARSYARIDASQVTAYAAKLQRTAAIADSMRDDWQKDWGTELTDTIRANVPVDTGELRDSIQQVEPGGIRIGAFYWRFVENGTSKMAPRPFVRPSIKKIRTPARKDASVRALRLLQK
jgi:HK97 gp10 family phage protein